MSMRLRFASARLAMRPSATQNAVAPGRTTCETSPRESRYKNAAGVAPSISGTHKAEVMFICAMLSPRSLVAIDDSSATCPWFAALMSDRLKVTGEPCVGDSDEPAVG